MNKTQFQSIPHSRPTLDYGDIQAVTEVIASGILAPGAISQKFGEHVAASYCCHFGMATNSCFSALHLATLALDMTQDYRIAIPALVCPTVKYPFNMCGAKIVVVDVDKISHQISIPEVLRLAEQGAIDGVLVPHRYGHTLDLAPLRDANLDIIEDFAHAAGAVDEQAAHQVLQGSIGVFSSYATKMYASGCGGVIITDSNILAERIRNACEYYAPVNDWNIMRYNYKMPDLNAALALSQWSRLSDFVAKRHAIAQHFLSEIPSYWEAITPEKNRASSWYRFIVRAQNKVIQSKILNEALILNVDFGRIDIALPPEELISRFPVAFGEWNCGLSVPIYPSLSQREQAVILSALNSKE